MGDSESGSKCDWRSVLHALHCEEHKNDLLRMQKIILNDPTSLTRKCESDEDFLFYNTYPLHHAILMKHVKCIQLLLEGGADPNLFDSERHTNPLLLTLQHVTPDLTKNDVKKLEIIVELLIKHGVLAEVPSDNNKTCKTQYVLYAIYSKSSYMLKMLLDHGCKIEHFNEDSEGKNIVLCSIFSTCITSAVLVKNYDAFKLLLLYNATLSLYFPINVKPYGIAQFMVDSFLGYENDKEIENIIDYVYAFYLHGGNLWLSLPGELEKLPKEHNTLPQLIRSHKLPLPASEILANQIEVLLSEPLSLQNQCRIAFKKILRREYLKKIELLPLPNDIISFLSFPELA